MASKAEECATRRLRAILAAMPVGESIPDSPEFVEALSGLEWFLPSVLAEIHAEWRAESLDGIYPTMSFSSANRMISAVVPRFSFSIRRAR